MSRLLCTLALVLTTPALAGAQIVVTLKNKFIEDNKHRATIEATFTVDKAHKNPNPPSKDADLHVAGRAPEIQLPIVAELMNAADDKIALDLIHAAETTGTPVAVTGAWRLWCEHGGTVTRSRASHSRSSRRRTPIIASSFIRSRGSRTRPRRPR